MNEPGRNVDPTALGPLGGETGVVTGPVEVFPGEGRYFKPKEMGKRRELIGAILPRLAGLLEDGERVLWIAPMVRLPRLSEAIGLGLWWRAFFGAAVAVTDRRIVEIELDHRHRVRTQRRSVPLDQIASLSMKGSKLAVRVAKGERVRWSAWKKGDRRLLRDLVANLQSSLPGDVHVPRATPLHHCSACGAATEQPPRTCASCGAEHTTARTAALLSLAFPGAGLWYAGHPALAALDLAGEALLFLLVATTFLFAEGTEGVSAALTLGVLGFLFTKAESAHLAATFARRARPVPRKGMWPRLAAAGGLVSVVAIAAPIVFSGALAGRLDEDLDLSGNDLGWRGGFDRGAWAYGVEEGQRSEWIREDGQALFVFGFPIGGDVGFASLEKQLRREAAANGHDPVAWVTVGGRRLLRTSEPVRAEDGATIRMVRWWLHDGEHEDVHILNASCPAEAIPSLEAELGRLLETARWVPIEEE